MLKVSWALVVFKLFRKYFGAVETSQMKSFNKLQDRMDQSATKLFKEVQKRDQELQDAIKRAEELKEVATVKHEALKNVLGDAQNIAKQEIQDARKFMGKLDDFLK